MKKVNKNMPGKLFERLLDESFVRYLKGNASEGEKSRWHDWENEAAENADLVERGRALLEEGVHRLPKPDVDSELDRLMDRIDSERQYDLINSVRIRHKKLVWATMAAAAGILLLIGFLARHTILQNGETTDSRAPSITYQTLSTDFGQRTSIRYSDGSEIVVNAQSQLRLPEKTVGSDTMRVWLEGEAFFSIPRKDSSDPRTFIVHTSDGDISVLGTKFVVNTREELTSVVLAEGSIRVDVRKESNHSLQQNLAPGELALFSQSLDNIQLSQVNPEVYTSWTSDSLVLDNTPLSDLLKRIETTYGVEVEVGDEQLLQERLTGKLDNLELKLLLEGLSQTLNVDIRREGQKIYINE